MSEPLNDEQEDLIHRIAIGESELLNMSAICKLLKISRSTLERLIKLDNSNKPDSQTVPFPKPDLKFGKSPRWTMDTFKKWLQASLDKQGVKP